MKKLTTAGTNKELNAEQFVAVTHLLRRSRREIESKIQGTSMTPTLPEGIRIQILCSSGQTYTRGQVIAYIDFTKIIAHRVIYRGHRGQAKHYLITQGDSMWLPDPPINIQSILGTVSAMDAEGRWQTPRDLGPRPLVHRCFLFAVRAVVCSALEINISLATWLTITLRRFRSVVARIRTYLRSIQS